ncbi:MAG TPA: isochorismatase family cysteine hydrolase [Alphaproteobacteria bacterium]|jgi:nicotinamidase-related amidase
MAVISRLDPTLGGDHTALVLFDALNGYLYPKNNPEKSVFLKEKKILPNLKALQAGARAAGMTTFYPMGAHAADGSDTVLRLTDTDINLKPMTGKPRPIGLHMDKNSKDAQIPDAFKPLKTDVLVPKHRWSAFFDTDLHFHLRMRNIDTIILAGGSTDVGIASTIFAARDLDLGLVIVRDACYSMRGPNHDFLMDRIFARMGRILSVADTVKLMEAGTRKKKPKRK